MAKKGVGGGVIPHSEVVLYPRPKLSNTLWGEHLNVQITMFFIAWTSISLIF